MAIKIQSSKDFHVNGIKCVVYGSSGVGKTVLCSTAPRPIIISAEQGLLSLASLDIPYVEVNSIKDIGDAFDMLKSHADYDTICIDSLSEIAEVVLADFKKTVADGRQAYMKIAEALGALIKNFRDLKGKNVVFVAKAKRVEDEETGSNVYEPFMPGKVLPFQLPYLVDEVFYYEMDRKGERKLCTKASRKFTAKDRSGKLDEFEAPDLNVIFNKIANKVN